MSISYNVTGAERKALVGTISEILGKPAVYQYTPSYAYMVGDCTIDKSGAVSMPDSDELTRLVTALAERGYATVTVESGTAESADADSAPTEDITEAESAQAANGENSDTLTISMPLDGFTPEKLDNLRKLLESKTTLIKKALTAEALPIAMDEAKLRFPWFTITGADGEMDAYMRFIVALCKMAKEQKRITAKDKDTDNDKFAMRIFLIRLGFVGPEFKAARKILLRNLTGNSSWRSGQQPERVLAAETVETVEMVAPDEADQNEEVGEL